MAVRSVAVDRALPVADTVGAVVVAAAAVVVARAARLAAAAGREGFVAVALVALALFALVEIAAAFGHAFATTGPLARRRGDALARLGASLALTLALSASAGGGDGRDACLAALLFVLLALPAAPMALARLLEAQLARQLPQLVAARLAARVGVTAALAGPAALLLLQKVRADLPAVATLALVALFLLAGSWRARDDAFVRELRLQARRSDSRLAPELRAELLAAPLAAEVAALCPLTPAQFEAFRAACERRYARRVGARARGRPT